MDNKFPFKNPYLLAPMAGITDGAFRQVCAELGAGFTYTEMVSAKGISYDNLRTRLLITVSNAEGNAALQLFGDDGDIIAASAKEILDEMGGQISLVDINMGCPAPKIVKSGEGCALMKDEVKAGRIIEKVAAAVHVPLTVKFRAGWDEESKNFLSFAKMCENAGAAAVCLHPRTRDQFYSGKARRELIGEVVSYIKIPVIGNGDIKSISDANEMMKATGCEAVMIARGALGNPHIFSGEKPDVGTLMRTAVRHLELAVENKGETAIPEFRKHAAWYTKGIAGGAKIRDALMSEKDARKIKDLLLSLADGTIFKT